MPKFQTFFCKQIINERQLCCPIIQATKLYTFPVSVQLAKKLLQIKWHFWTTSEKEGFYTRAKFEFMKIVIIHNANLCILVIVYPN